MGTSRKVNVALAQLLDAAWSSDAVADRVAVVEGDREWTYRELRALVAARIQVLRGFGVEKGFRVAFLLGANLEWVVTYYALNFMGAISIPINTTWTFNELRDGLARTEAQVFITQPEFKGNDVLNLLEAAVPGIAEMHGGAIESNELPLLKRILIQKSAELNAAPSYADLIPEALTGAGPGPSEEPLDVRPEDEAMYLLTSGSTAFPKPVVHTHATLAFAFETFAELGNVETNDIWLLSGTTYHVSAYLGLILPHLRGGEVVLIEYFSPGAALELIERHRINTMWGFDTHFTAMLRHPDYQTRNASSLQKLWLGSNPATFDEVRKLGAEWHGNIYGNSESVACAAFFPWSQRADIHKMKYSHGLPVPGAQVSIVDPETGEELPAGERGEVCIAGPQVFKGYYRMPEETQKAFLRPGVHRTGDRGWKDEDGFLYFAGRYKEMLKSGGENVSVAEVEQSLKMNLGEIEAAVVVGVPDERWGDKVVALVELKEGVVVTGNWLREKARPFLAGYKLPKHFLISSADDWAVTPTGKIDRKELTKLAIQRLEAEESVTNGA